jgi:hypothetical protein
LLPSTTHLGLESDPVCSVCSVRPPGTNSFLDEIGIECPERTLATLLFGIGWPLRHRVVPNAATERWCGATRARSPYRPRSRPGQRTARARHPTRRDGEARCIAAPQPSILHARSPLAGMSQNTVERSALYAGESARHIHDIIPAAQALTRLTPG